MSDLPFHLHLILVEIVEKEEKNTEIHGYFNKITLKIKKETSQKPNCISFSDNFSFVACDKMNFCIVGVFVYVRVVCVVQCVCPYMG